MSKIDCSKFCKKTKAVRESKYCEKWCEIKDEIVFSCDINIEKAEEKEKNLLSCIYNDIKYYDACKKCGLICDKNKNPNLEKKLEQEKKLNAVIDSLKSSSLPVNMNPEKLKEISKSFSKDENVLKNTTEAIEAVNIARNILEGLSEGRTPDPSSFAIIANHFKNKFKKRR